VVIVDTTVWIDYFRGQENPETEWLDREVGRQPLGLIDLILCEILQGVQPENAVAAVRGELKRFELFETGGEDLAVAAAENFRKLRKRGRTVRKTIDGLIATFCVIHGHALLHRDRDFDHFEELLQLAVVHP
jgi:predicted nucleic acid-binding protein